MLQRRVSGQGCLDILQISAPALPTPPHDELDPEEELPEEDDVQNDKTVMRTTKIPHNTISSNDSFAIKYYL